MEDQQWYLLLVFLSTWVKYKAAQTAAIRSWIRCYTHTHTHFECSFYCWCYVFVFLTHTSFWCLSDGSFPTATSTTSTHKHQQHTDAKLSQFKDTLVFVFRAICLVSFYFSDVEKPGSIQFSLILNQFFDSIEPLTDDTCKLFLQVLVPDFSWENCCFCFKSWWNLRFLDS